ncbi:MAG: SDR family oxidoreductase [Gammaproteobacteria bacterium]|nr:SDR family oxidoreductase [Gammaproteobacteria bacterium]
MSNLESKVAIVTGSTNGIGEGIAKMLSSLGVHVSINSVSSIEKGNKLSKELNQSIYIQGDIGIENDCKRIVNETIKKFGRIDILVNNAGKSAFRTGDILDISNDYFTETLNINVVGTWCIIREAMPYLKKSGDGNIINITSCAGIDPASASKNLMPYSVAKAAINHLTKFLAKHCGPEVRANAIAPGLIMTPRTENSDEAVDKFKSRSPLKRTGVPADIAELVIAIIKSNYINGEIILVDGGFSTV